MHFELHYIDMYGVPWPDRSMLWGVTGDYNEGLEKAAAIYILCRLLGQPCNALPTQEDDDDDAGDGTEQPAAVATHGWTPGVQFADDDDDDDAAYREGWDGRVRKVGERAPESAGRCVICLSRFATPVRTLCGHVFCLGCMKHHISSSNAAAGSAARGGAAAAAVPAALRGSAYAPGARCPVCRMPCAMSDLRPAEFEDGEQAKEAAEEEEEDQFGDGGSDKTAAQTGGGAVATQSAAGTASAASAPAGGWMQTEEGGGGDEDDDDWAAAEAAWAAAEAEADLAGR